MVFTARDQIFSAFQPTATSRNPEGEVVSLQLHNPLGEEAAPVSCACQSSGNKLCESELQTLSSCCPLYLPSSLARSLLFPADQTQLEQDGVGGLRVLLRFILNPILEIGKTALRGQTLWPPYLHGCPEFIPFCGGSVSVYCKVFSW